MPATTGPAPGLYVHVIDGVIALSNRGGTTSFSAGQFGFVPSLQQPPVIVPANPGLQFSPPPAFTAPASTNAPTSRTQPAAVDCVVR